MARGQHVYMLWSLSMETFLNKFSFQSTNWNDHQNKGRAYHQSHHNLLYIITQKHYTMLAL